jgi:hypothetical protein
MSAGYATTVNGCALHGGVAAVDRTTATILTAGVTFVRNRPV